METNTPFILPPKEVFEDEGQVIGGAAALAEGQINNIVTSIEYPEEGGILVYRQGDKYPSKGWPFFDAVFAVDIVKRVAFNAVRFLISSPVRYFVPLFFLLPGFLKKKIISKAIYYFSDLTYAVVFSRSGTYIKPQYFCTMVREIYRVGVEMASDDEGLYNLVRAICMVLEFDDAYRYRLQDMVMLINKDDLLDNPARELNRVFAIAAARGKETSDRFSAFAKVLPFIFAIKSIREPLVSFFSKVDLEKLYLDEYDWYKCLIWGGYEFGGIPDKDRVSMRMMIDAQWNHDQSKLNTQS